MFPANEDTYSSLGMVREAKTKWNSSFESWGFEDWIHADYQTDSIQLVFFLLILLTFCFSPLNPPVSDFVVSAVSSLTHQLDTGLLVFLLSLALCLYPPLVFVPTVWWSCDVPMLVRQLDLPWN